MIVDSLIGSWGPLFLPLPWQAFLEWWAANCPEILDLAAQNASEKIRSFSFACSHICNNVNYLQQKWIC